MSKAKAMRKARLASIETGTFNPMQARFGFVIWMGVALQRYEIDALKSMDDAKARRKLHMSLNSSTCLLLTSPALQRFGELTRVCFPEVTQGVG